MNINTIKYTWVAVIVTIIILLVTSTSMLAASTEMTTENCNYKSHQGETSLPQCCLMSDNPLSHCMLTNTTNIKILHTSRMIQAKIVYLAWSKTDVTTETSPDLKKPIQWASTKEIPQYCYAEHHCRNCLNSEEPPQA